MGPQVAGLFLAFPSIFPASATLIQNQERAKKQRKGLDGEQRGIDAAGADAMGAASGSWGLPIVSQILEASEEKPCLAMSLKLEMPVIRELLAREEIPMVEAPSDAPAMATGEITVEFLNAGCRLLELLDTPKDIPFLSGLIQREIIYRILQGPEGARLRAIATLGDQSNRTAKAIAWTKANYAKPLRVEDLAKVAGMGESTLHGHLRALTAMSPLQYQKQLRLQQARGRMLVDGVDAMTAAFEVGYESASQFNREYSRLFGQPPMRDIRTLRTPGAAGLEGESSSADSFYGPTKER
jgi:AraC-like DNA-binding protein